MTSVDHLMRFNCKVVILLSQQMLVLCFRKQQVELVFVDRSDLTQFIEEWAVLINNFDNCSHTDHILKLICADKSLSTRVPSCYSFSFESKLLLDMR